MKSKGPFQFVIMLGSSLKILYQIFQCHWTFPCFDFVFEQVSMVGRFKMMKLLSTLMRSHSDIVEVDISFIKNMFKIHQLKSKYYIQYEQMQQIYKAHFLQFQIIFILQRMTESQGNSFLQALKTEAQEQARRTSQKVKEKFIQKDQENHANPFLSKIPLTKNLFADKQKRNSPNLFQNNKPTVNLFKNNENQQSSISAKSIFDILAKPSISKSPQKKEDHENMSESGESRSNQSTFKTEPQTRVMKYNYKNESEKIKDFLLKKFKSGDNPAKEEIYVSIEKIVDQINTLYVIVRNQATKTAIYRGIIMKNISKMDNFMGKKDNLRIQVLKKSNPESSYSQYEEEEKKEKIVKQIIKMQFYKEQECKQFEEIVKNYFGE